MKIAERLDTWLDKAEKRGFDVITICWLLSFGFLCSMAILDFKHDKIGEGFSDLVIMFMNSFFFMYREMIKYIDRKIDRRIDKAINEIMTTRNHELYESFTDFVKKELKKRGYDDLAN